MQTWLVEHREVYGTPQGFMTHSILTSWVSLLLVTDSTCAQQDPESNRHLHRALRPADLVDH